MLASVLGSLAALASMAVTLALCYLFWRKRSAAKEAKDELEPLQVGAPTPSQGTPNKGPQQGNKANNKSVVELTRHNVEDRLYQGAAAAASSLSLDSDYGICKSDKNYGTKEVPCPKPVAVHNDVLGGVDHFDKKKKDIKSEDL
ncbi:uncharacterized protein TNCV_4088051 [Trichonephila clavipes]|nr:uncharacterized protein TNCV_4088051 [Trichonephila clavipes]